MPELATLPAPVRPPPRIPTGTVRAPRGYRGHGELWDIKDRYLTWMVATNYARFTVQHAHTELSQLLRFLEAKGIRRIADVSSEVLDCYSLAIREPKNGLPPRPNYLLHRLTVLKKFFDWLARQQIILLDPAEDLEVPKLHQTLPHTILTQAEARRILEAPNLRSPIGYRDRALLELLYATGIRSRELMRLKIENIDVKNRLVNVIQGKCRKDRIIPIPRLALAFVMEYVAKVRPRFARNMKADDGTLFLNWTGANIEINRLCEIIRKNAKLAGVPKRVSPP
ncbi:MAG: tyrosine-type recombinase/integrase [Elusimicrobiota bacterium]